MAAALSSTSVLATRPVVVAKRATQSRPIRAVRVEAHKQDAFAGVKLAAAGLAAGLMMQTGVAEAGVQMVQPEIKKVFQGEASIPAEKPNAAPKPKATPSASVMSEGPSVAAISIPGAIIGLVGLTAVASKVDGDFSEFMAEALLKDSTDYAGYEPELKAGKV